MDTVWLERGVSAGTAILSLAIVFLAIKCFRQMEKPLKWPKFWYSVSGALMFIVSVLGMFGQSNLFMYELISLFVTANIFSSLLGTVTRISLQQFMFEEERKKYKKDENNGCR